MSINRTTLDLAEGLVGKLTKKQLREIIRDYDGSDTDSKDRKTLAENVRSILYEDYAFVIPVLKKIQKFTNTDLHGYGWLEPDSFYSEEERLEEKQKFEGDDELEEDEEFEEEREEMGEPTEDDRDRYDTASSEGIRDAARLVLKSLGIKTDS
jgi:hypothetical protein